ncbi:AraC family transcriptional regulator [Escherichia coli]|nr:AraC family transcriptional regulator [Escherichia coli]
MPPRLPANLLHRRFIFRQITSRTCFKKTGAIGFNEYLNHTRLEHAKTLLKGYDLKVKEVAHACGFVDSNYFCRLFRKNTERSPSEYRRQYHSQLTEKPTTPE